MENLKSKRIEKGLTQKQLAERVGVSQQAIGFYENGDRFPNREILIKLAKTLDCKVDDIL